MTGKRLALLRGAAQSAILSELGFRQLVEASSIHGHDVRGGGASPAGRPMKKSFTW
jgi:hypothetical protein